MDNSLAVSVVEGIDDLSQDANRFTDGKLALALQFVSQGLALDIWHHEVEKTGSFTRVVQGKDVRVGQPGDDLDLPVEPLGPDRTGDARLEHLDGDPAIMLEVVREEDEGHRARSELALDRVAVGECGT